ncbi:hypothetical protein [Asticcacaulis sp. AND118]|uniref:hypothetical protein n=1 Tax=Asticcacaulis sp. AND118 TaxID=2840468 RepID=UPI001CFFBD43|nr:hypothetical protein [Asticcacaulis sp. AND118]UDF03498.1 hypothetical protein LH365_00210 [Asticcacaulis sp. AND118]
MAKRDELHKLRKALESEIHKVTCDIDHLDAAIALFDPQNTPRAITRYVTKHRAKKGSVQKFVLSFFRTATGPVTSKDITTAWLEARGLRTDDETYVVIRKRIGACLTKYRTQGIIEGCGHAGDFKAWRLVG